ncbi:DMT family transporter [Microbacterium trichothecenolyticum]|uniref:DMT family transporter n=1 Tax=Microbacterium ureisolvens TaxID=2781186 RepID=A0ABS7HX55_9MICO|nr:MULTISPECIES: DMT family transporter [Microbacterium]MBW9108959.1 DMT family transporter [Microbacterium ureisolvens]MBW9119917.1 DMT family transporter [Microbacterium trichothecenolyticum]
MTDTRPAGEPGRALPAVAVAVSVLLWSTTYVLSDLVLVTASPAVLSELRLVLALPLMWVLLRLRRRSAGRELWAALRRPTTLILGLTGVALFYLPSNLGLSISTPGTASVMSATLPVLTALFAWTFIGERPTPPVICGLALTTVGIVLASAGSIQPGFGAVLLVAGLASYAAYTVLLRWLGSAPAAPARPTTDALTLATATAVWGSLLLMPWVGWEVASGVATFPVGVASWSSMLFLALVVTGPTMALYNYGAERVPAAVAGTATAVVPVLGYAYALLLGEPLVLVNVTGAGLAFLGVALATVPWRSRSRGSADSSLPAPPVVTAAGSRPHYEGARQ